MEMTIPISGETPLASVSGIQFGLMTRQDILNLSVYPADFPLLKPKELVDPKLGLPIGKGKCGTCNGETVEQCQGHFAHCKLPTPIFHPNHVGKLVKVLRKVCLNCGQPRKKKARNVRFLVGLSEAKMVQENVSTVKKTAIPIVAHEALIIDDDNDDDEGLVTRSNKRKYVEAFIDQEARVEQEASESVIVLSSDEDLPSSVRKYRKVRSEVDEEDHLEKASSLSGRRSWNFRKRKSPTDSTDNTSPTGSFIDLTHLESWNPLSVVKGGKMHRTGDKHSQSGVDVVGDMFFAIPRNEDFPVVEERCKYCSGADLDRYPEVHIKVEIKERGKDENLSKAIRMELNVRKKKLDRVATDYWGFVEGKKGKNAANIPKSRLLLPSEALRILKKIPDSALSGLGMHKDLARPEALIIECIPVPPNCLRIQDDPFGSTNIGFKQGIDRATLTFSKLLNKIYSVSKSRVGKPLFLAAAVEASELQSLFGLYLREKGAAKAVPGKEKKRIDHVGRVQKKDARWSLDWLKRHVLGKRSCYSARNVLTGDPFLRVEEIGIPQEMAKYVTIPERVNQVNKAKLQECVDIAQECTGRYRACGAVSILRGGDCHLVTRKTEHTLEIGDIVHRHLQNGDLVYVNRPPSLHKHSLLALRAHIQDLAVFTINPSICAPLHADFDGDCLHLFVPQSEECKAELNQLMTIPAQLLPSQDAKPIIGMSQDCILAAYLLTSTPVFLTKDMMFQIAMWNTRRLPVPAIVKAPIGGPLWAGTQVMDITIPSEFSYKNAADGVAIQDGELVSPLGNWNWLTSTSGLIRALAQYNTQAAVNHLDSSQSALREWLLSHGFSVSLRDFYGVAERKLRKRMISKLISSLDHEQKMAVNRELIFDEKFQKVDAIQSGLDVEEVKDLPILEDIAVGYFQEQFSSVGEELGSSIGVDNHLLAMVRSGSKGSLSKVVQQIGCLGLQLLKGAHLLSLDGNRKLHSLASSMRCEERWEARGLVKSSLLDGLDPLEFYLHAISVRAGILRQSLEVAEPGELFKKLMLFLRDIHIAYDKTVRNKFGFDIIQFSYDGVEPPNWGKGPSQRETEFVIPGEAVGILAATAIAQPAYQVMLEANHNVGSKKIRPLALLQDTMFPRKESKAKISDCRVTLRLKQCSCNMKQIRRALYVKDELQPVAIQMLAAATAIEYIPASSGELATAGNDGAKLRLPWIGHIQLDKKAMIQMNINMERVVHLLEAAFKSKAYSRVLASSYLRDPEFYYRNVCHCMGVLGGGKSSGPCLHFSASLRSRTSKRLASRSDKKFVEFVDALRDVMIPLILKTIVKGDQRIDSVKIIWEDAAWSPSGFSDDGHYVPANPNGELVVEVTIEEKLNTTRGIPWNIVKELCSGMDVIDWRRSAPYSIHEVQHALGLEAARDCILQRLTLATKAAGTTVNSVHLKLVADLMVHAGEVNGITPFGYRDLLKSLKTSAPFTAGAFRAPIKTFMEAGEKGEEEMLSGVLASSIFGKRVPVGTGSNFSLHIQRKVEADTMELPMDIHGCLEELKKKIGVEIPEPGEDCYGDIHDGTFTGGDEWGDVDIGINQVSPIVAHGSEVTPSDMPQMQQETNHETSDWGRGKEDVKASDCPCVEASGWDEEVQILPSAETNLSVPGCDYPISSTTHSGDSLEKVNEWNSNIVLQEDNSDSGWDAVDRNPNPEINWTDQHDAHGTGLNNGSVDRGGAVNDPRASADNGTFEKSSGRKGEMKVFQPTGANTIPLGKVRHFGPKVIDLIAADIQHPRHQKPLARLDPEDDNENSEVGEVQNSTWHEDKLEESCWDPQQLGEEPSDWGGKEVTVNACESETRWEDVEHQGFKEVPLDWSSPHSGWNAGWSPRARQTGDIQVVSDGGLSPSKELLKKNEPRIDSEDWKKLIKLVKSVRDMLMSSELEEKLKKEFHHLLMTQVLVHHPTFKTKVGCGIDFFKVAYHKATKHIKPTKCFYLVRKDGTEDDFSYHKCLRAMASKKNPPLDDMYTAAFMAYKSNRMPMDGSHQLQNSVPTGLPVFVEPVPDDKE